jgi:hypothetical protein
MSIIAVASLLIVAGYLTVSAAAKAVDTRAATAALADFGLATAIAQFAVRTLVVIELTVASVLVLWPHALAAQASCVTLFGMFALFGALALRRGRSIECGCMGALHRSTLGWPQIVQFAAVVGIVFVVGGFAPSWGVRTGIAVLFSLEVAAAGMLLAHLSRIWWRIRLARVSLAHTRAVARRLGWTATLPAPAGEESLQ